MSKNAQKPQDSDRELIAQKVDRWVSRRRSHTHVGQESDWLGWDAWVCTDRATQRAAH